MTWTLYEWEKSPGQMSSLELVKDIFRGGPPQTMTREESTRQMEAALDDYMRAANELRASMRWALDFQKPGLVNIPKFEKNWGSHVWYNSFKKQTENCVSFAREIISYVKEHTPKDKRT